jgi:hypothetical protein
VVDDKAAAVIDASVNIHRGIFSMSTNATGNYNFSSVPAGTWEVSVHKDGFVDATQTVTVTENASASADFSLTPKP